MFVEMKSNTIIWLLPDERVCQTLTSIVDVQLVLLVLLFVNYAQKILKIKQICKTSRREWSI